MTYSKYAKLRKFMDGIAQNEWKKGRLIASGLAECEGGQYNPPSPGDITRWVTISGQYVCTGTTKYAKEKQQKSSDNGVTWVDTGNIRTGSIIETNSVDCGYTPSHDYSREYLTISSLEDNNVIKWIASSSDRRKTVSVSTDNGQTWTEKTSSTGTGTALATLNAGDKLLLKGLNPKYYDSYYGPTYFSTTKGFSVYGNIMSLIGGDDFANITSLTADNLLAFGQLFDGCAHLVDASNLILPATTLRYARNCYSWMFRNCTSLTTAPALPATTLSDSCYYEMFQGCTSLITAPTLPATILAEYCYTYMFQGCTSLTTAPSELPSTTLTNYCYSHMFDGCKSLTKAPELPATTLARNCYHCIFQACTSLNYIKCLATDISARTCTTNWTYRVSSTGTFVKAPSMSSWETGANGIPSGWTVQDA